MPKIKKKYPARSWICNAGKHFWEFLIIVSKLIEAEFIVKILKNEREKHVTIMKKLKITATQELEDIFKIFDYIGLNAFSFIDVGNNLKVY